MRKTLVFLVLVLVFVFTSSVYADGTNNSNTDAKQQLYQAHNQGIYLENRAQGLTVTAQDVGLDQNAQYLAMPADAEMVQNIDLEVVQEIQSQTNVTCDDKGRVWTAGNAGANQGATQQQMGLAGNGYIGVQSGTSTQVSASSVVSTTNSQ